MAGKTKKIHFAGAVQTRRCRILPGWAACCSGARALQIRADGQHTYNPDDVTCGTCKRIMAQDTAERYQGVTE